MHKGLLVPRSMISGVLRLSVMLLSVMGGSVVCQDVGRVTSVVPDASRNAAPVVVNDQLRLNDLLRTNGSGRLQAELVDACNISLGSNSEIVLNRTPAPQIYVAAGELHCRTEKGSHVGPYQVATKNAQVVPHRTDFVVIYDVTAKRTTVICNEGSLTVTPLLHTKVIDSNNRTTGRNNSVSVEAGEMVVIGPSEKAQFWRDYRVKAVALGGALGFTSAYLLCHLR